MEFYLGTKREVINCKNKKKVIYLRQGGRDLECQVCCMFMCMCMSWDAQANSH